MSIALTEICAKNATTMKKLVILEYSTGAVHIYDVAPQTSIDEEYISNLGYRVSDCSWMISNQLGIFHHQDILK